MENNRGERLRETRGGVLFSKADKANDASLIHNNMICLTMPDTRL